MSNRSSTFLAFLTGIAAGVMIGVLYAPDKGKNTRDKLSFRLTKYRDKLKELIDELMEEKHSSPNSAAKSEGQKVINDAKEKAEKLLGDVEDLIGQIKTKK